MTFYENVIVIPYRNRKEHLDYFLQHSWILLKQHLPNTKLVIVEQEEGKLFNRGKILNVGFQEYLDKTHYFITHDVDVNPNENAIEIYKSIPSPNTIIGIYSSPCKTLGGIIKIHTDSLKMMNGFPNDFWGWGVEDRCLYNRSVFFKFNISFNIISRTAQSKQYFNVFDNINDRKRDTKFGKNTSFEYKQFHKLPNSKQLEHIMKSGLNNLEYTVLERKDLDENVEWIKVSI